MCGVWRGAIQRQRVDGMHGVWAWVCDECCGGDGRYHHMHGMCGRTVQQRVDGGVRRVSGGINDGRALGDRGDYVRGVCGWSVQQHVDDGVCAVCGGSVPGAQQPDVVHGLWCWVDDGHVGWSGCNSMLGVWRWAVQQHIDGGVRAMSGRIGDGHACIVKGDDMHGVRCWAVQCSGDDGMRSVPGGVGDEHVGGGGWHFVHGMHGRTVQQRIDGGMCCVPGRIDDGLA